MEHGWSRAVRLYDQSAHRALLHARPQHDTRPWSRSALWRLRDAGFWVNASVPASPRSRSGMERRSSQDFVLGYEPRPVFDVRLKLATRRPSTYMGFRRARILV